MSGLYIHIPFCKQACHYCDFHFSTTLKRKDEMFRAMHTELLMRREEWDGLELNTIYFGGGTPSLLTVSETADLLNTIHKNYRVRENPEITLEANPDDLSRKKLKELADVGINRLSIGIQSFFEQDLRLMNRAHNADEAVRCLEDSLEYFSNISIDLIYGIPGSSTRIWEKNLEKGLSFNLPHISSYALTVEPRTALQKFIQKGKLKEPDESAMEEQFELLQDILHKEGYVHYEISNFGKPGYFSENNTAYWKGVPYMGIGPSAHSFDGAVRSWNIRNNIKYISSLKEGILPSEKEILTTTDRYNEYVMTSLRTIWGISLEKIRMDFGPDYETYLLSQANVFMNDGKLKREGDIIRAADNAKFLIDGIASHLFMLNLEK